MIRLYVTAGEQSFAFDYDGERPLTVGRLQACGLTIAHPDVSRRHLVIEPLADGAFLVRDLGSLHGVLHNGTWIEHEAIVLPGDELQLGEQVRLRFGDEEDVRAWAAQHPQPPGEQDAAGAAAPAPAEQQPVAGAGAGADGPQPAGDSAAVPEVGAPEARAQPPAVEARVAPHAQPAASAPRRQVLRRRRTAASRAITGAIWLGAGCALLWFAYLAYDLVTRPPAQAPPEIAGGGAPAAGTPAAGAGQGEPAVEPAVQQQAAASPAAAEWRRLERAELEPELMLAALRDFVARYPGTRYAELARVRAETLERVRAQLAARTEAAMVPVLEREVERLLGARQFGEAWYLVQAAPRLGLAGEALLVPLRRRVEQAAYQAFSEVREAARASLAAGKALEAYDALARAGMRLGGLEFQAEVEAELEGLRRSLQRSLQVIADTQATASAAERGRLEILRPKAERAVLACRFEEAIATYREILGLPLTAAERLEMEWRLYDARRMSDLFRLLLAEVAAAEPGKQRIRVPLGQGITGEVAAADVRGVRFEALIAGERSRPVIEKRWEELPPVTIAEVLQGAAVDADAQLALASYAFAAGLEEHAHRALLAVYERWPAFRPEVASLLARQRGAPVPVGELVAFEGRLITRAERAAIIAQRERARAEAEAIREELAAAARERQAQRYFDAAVKLMDEGSYQAGLSVFAEIVRRLPETEVGRRAKARLEDPFLRRRPLQVSGPDTNRVSMVFLAEGYQLDAEQQRSFDAACNTAFAILKHTDPWDEYAGYFNFYAMNIRSQDRGVDREPGGISKETALGGRVVDGVFTVDNALARGFVERFAGPSVAICLGNDSASVATGGGGVCAVAKGMLEVCGHEIGHAFAALGDEYDHDPAGGGQGVARRAEGHVPAQVLAPNLVAGNRREEMLAIVPWAHWTVLGPANWTGQPVDLFEGGNRVPFDVWRPQRDCKMRTATSRFCAVCMEQMVLRLYAAVNVIDDVHPRQEVVEVKASESPLFRVIGLRPRSRPLEAEFLLEAVVVQDDGSTVVRRAEVEPRRLRGEGTDLPDGRFLYQARATGLESGQTYRLTVTLRDPTPWVALPDRSALEDRHVWRIVVR